MRKALCTILLLAILLVCCGCSMSDKDGDDMRRSVRESASSSSFETQSDFTMVFNNGIEKSPFYDFLLQRSEYNSLSDETERLCYDKVNSAVFNVSSKSDQNGYYPIKDIIINNVEMSQDKIKKVISAFKNDNPDVFWVVNMFGYIHDNGSTKIQLYSFLPADICQDNINKVNAAFLDVVKNIPSGSSQYQREKYVHDWVVDNCTYNQSALNNRDKEWASFSVLGVALNKTAVCEGYSRTFQLLLSYAGIPSRLVSGSSRQNPHMWNLVCIDGSWYHVDATFNDADDFPVYSYFNLTDELIKSDHSIDPNYSDSRSDSSLYVNGTNDFSEYNLDLPKCNQTAANYFVMEAVKIKSLDNNSDNDAIENLYSKAINKEDSISFMIDTRLNYQDTVDKLLIKQPYKVFYYVDEVNNRLSFGYKIDSKSLSFVKSEKQRAVTVKLNYK